VREQLVALAKLGRIDASTRDLDERLRSIPAEVDELRENVTILEGLLAKERDQLLEAQKLRDDQDEQIKAAGDTLARSKAKAAQARNAREAEAVERELEAVRRTMRDREAEREKLTGAIEKVSSSLEKHEQEFGGLRDMLAEKEAEAQKQVAEVEAERSKALAGREEITKLLPGDVLRRYERIRGRFGMATADAVDGTCMGCRLSMRPMQFIAVQRGETFEECPQCKRFLVDPAWLEAEAVPPVRVGAEKAAPTAEPEASGEAPVEDDDAAS